MAREENSCFTVVGRLLSRGSPLMAALLFLVGSAISAHAESNRPRTVIESPTFNWGSVPQGTKVTTDFVVKNSGDIDLVLQRIVPSCGCTATSASANRIPPGGQGAVHVEVDTSGFAGAKEKMVRLFTNDPDQPYSTLTMKGVIEPDVSVEPYRITLQEIQREQFKQPVTAEFTVKVRPGSPASIGDVTAFSKFLTVEPVASQERADKQHTVRVSLDPKVPNGEFRDRVVVSLAGAAVTSINVPVIASIRGAIQLNPATLSFGVVEGEQVISKRVRLENSGSEDLTILGVESDSEAVAARFSVRKPGKQFDITVDVDPRRLTNDLRSAITIKTSSASEGVLTLAVYGILPPKTR